MSFHPTHYSHFLSFLPIHTHSPNKPKKKLCKFLFNFALSLYQFYPNKKLFINFSEETANQAMDKNINGDDACPENTILDFCSLRVSVKNINCITGIRSKSNCFVCIYVLR